MKRQTLQAVGLAVMSAILCLSIAQAAATKPASATKSAAAVKPTKPAEKMITLDLKVMSVRDALTILFDKAGKSYMLTNGIDDTIQGLSFKNVKFETALDAILKTSDLVYTIDDGIYVVSPAEIKVQAEAEAVPSETVVTKQPEEVTPPSLQPIEQTTPVQQYLEIPQGFAPDYGAYNPYQPMPEYQYGNPYMYPNHQNTWQAPRNPGAGLLYDGFNPNRGMHPPRAFAPWRGVPRINGVPIY